MALTLPATRLGTRPAADGTQGSTRARRVPLTVLLLVGGLVALLVGAEVLVRGGTGLAGDSGFRRW